MQAAVRFHMSVFDVSQAELDAVCRRLAQSAGRWGHGPTSAHYVDHIASVLSADLVEPVAIAPAAM